jgi:hypothetical protein
MNRKNIMKKELTGHRLVKQQELVDYINQFFEKHNYKIQDNFDISSYSNKKKSLSHIRECGHLSNRCFQDIESDIDKNTCQECKSMKLKMKADTLPSFLPNDIEGEEWRALEGGFISNRGRAYSSIGTPLQLDERGRYKIGTNKAQYAKIIMAQVFDIKDIELTEGGQHSQFVVSTTLRGDLRSNMSNSGELNIEEIKVNSRSIISSENGKKSRKSAKFQEKMDMDLARHIEQFKYVRDLPEFPTYLIFEDGNIYNSKRGTGSNRFLTFSESKNENSKIYQHICRKKITYKVHRIMCYAFHPIEGKTCLKDYDDLEVNHKDANTLNNHKDNLEWDTREEQMKHAYEEGHHSKSCEVIQCTKNIEGTEGLEIARFKSIAEASRKTGIKEHVIRTNTKKGEFFWKYADPQKKQENSLKYRSGIKPAKSTSSSTSSK